MKTPSTLPNPSSDQQFWKAADHSAPGSNTSGRAQRKRPQTATVSPAAAPMLWGCLGHFRLAVALLGLAAFAARAGVALNLFYQSGYPGGGAVTNLTVNDPNFPGSPDLALAQTNGLQDFPASYGFGVNWGTWSRGFLEAPQTGTYTFWIASDDDSQFWLSTDATPANKVLICQNAGAVTLQEFNTHGGQKSAPVSLVAGQKYYFEVFHTKGSASAATEHFEVAWQLPNGTYEPIIDQKHLWAFPEGNLTGDPAPTAPQILTSYQGYDVPVLPGSITVEQGRPVDLTVTIEAYPPASVQWYSNSVAIPGANLASYHVPVGALQSDTVYSVTVSNNLGSASASTTISVTPDTTPPTLVDAINLGNPGKDIAVIFSEPVDPATAIATANYSVNNGATVTGARLGASPDTVLLQVNGITAGTGYTLTVNNVKDGAGNMIAANSTVALEQGLDTWLQMDESAGTTANDSSGNGKNGTLINGVWADRLGKVFRGYQFDGVGGYVQLPNGYSNFTGGLTISVWAYPTSLSQLWSRICDLGNGGGADNILFAHNATSDNLTYEVRLGGPTAGQVTAPHAFGLNQWEHFAVTEDGSGNVVIYRNGVVVATGVETNASGVGVPPNVVTRTQCYVGRSDFGGDGYYQGKYDDFRIYDRVLSPAAVAALAAGGGPDDVGPALPVVSLAATTPLTFENTTKPGVFTFTRTGDTSGPLTVQYAISGTATNGIQYTNIATSVTIPAGTNQATVQIWPIDFSFSELTRSVILTVAGDPGYYVSDTGSATVTIENNDIAPAAIAATADNALQTTQLNLVDVWFAVPVAPASATNIANYTLNNAPGVNITNAVIRTNYNVGVTLWLDNPVPPGATLTVSGVQDLSGHSATATIPVNLRVTPLNIVCDTYHGTTGTRSVAFSYVTDGVVNNLQNGAAGNYTSGFATGFDTFDGTSANNSHFIGMIYPSAVDFQQIKVDLGQQFGDGGDWQQQPHVFILKQVFDTASGRPEQLPGYWQQVPARLISGSSHFQTAAWPSSAATGNPSPNTPYVFDLSGLPADQRSGYGWAVGGVLGNGASGHSFLSFSEARAYGLTNGPIVGAPAILQQPTNATVVAGQRAIFSAKVSFFGNCYYQWYKNGSPIASFPQNMATNGYYTTPPETTADNGATFYLVATNLSGAVTSSIVTLTVLPRTNAPVVSAATMDLFGNIDVWFDEPVDPASAGTLANYAVNDPAITLTGVTVDSYQTRALLTFTGTPSTNNPAITVSSVMDTFGNTMSSPQTVALLPQTWPVKNIVANAYQQGRATELKNWTNGLFNYASADGTTFSGNGIQYFGFSDFVGLTFSQPQVFGVMKVDLGRQFVDGGDWSEKPRLYLLKDPVDSNQAYPETSPHWVQVTNAILISGNIFNWEVDGPVGTPLNTPIAFDVSHLPPDQRTGYGWAVGGVPGNARALTGNGISPAVEFLSITELRSFGVPASSYSVSGAPQLLLDARPLSQTLPGGVPVSYTTAFGGSPPLVYQWKHNNVPMSDDTRITGTHTNVLTIGELLPGDAGTYQVVVTNSLGAAVSSVVALGAPTRVDFSSADGWIQNGGAGATGITNGTLVLTAGTVAEVSSVFLNTPQYIGAFKATWTYQESPGAGAADGMCFVVQNVPSGPAALGGGGGSLGYNNIGSASAAVEFNIYSPNTVGIAFRTNGATGAPYSPTTPVNIASGDPIGVTLAYDGTTLSLTLTDAVAQVSFSTNWAANLPLIVNNTNTATAYVGFTGADGGVLSRQVVSNFQFVSLPAIGLSKTGNNFSLTWPSLTGAFQLQRSSDLTGGNWINVTNPLSLINGMNQVVVPATSSNQFYRLVLP